MNRLGLAALAVALTIACWIPIKFGCTPGACPTKYTVVCDPSPTDWRAETWEDALYQYDRFTVEWGRPCVITTPKHGPVNPDTLEGRREP